MQDNKTLHFMIKSRDDKIRFLETANKNLSANLKYRKKEVEELTQKNNEQREEIKQLKEEIKRLEHLIDFPQYHSHVRRKPTYREMMKAQGRW